MISKPARAPALKTSEGNALLALCACSAILTLALYRPTVCAALLSLRRLTAHHTSGLMRCVAVHVLSLRAHDVPVLCRCTLLAAAPAM